MVNRASAERGGKSASPKLAPLVAGYVLALTFVAIFGLLSLSKVRETASTMNEVLSGHAENAIEVQHLTMLSERIGRTGRSYLLSGNGRFLRDLDAAREAFSAALVRLRASSVGTSAQRLLELVGELETEHEDAVNRVVQVRAQTGRASSVTPLLEAEVQPIRDRLVSILKTLTEQESAAFARARTEAEKTATMAIDSIAIAAVVTGAMLVGLTVLLGRTVRKLRRIRQDLDTLIGSLEERNKDLDAFAGRIAHDVGNLLAPLRITANHLQNVAGDDHRVRSSAERIERVTLRAAAFIAALLAFARAGQTSDDAPSATAVAPVLDETLDALASQRSLVGAEIDVDLEKDIRVACSAGLLQIVLFNLIGNALKFLEGRPVRKVQVQGRVRGPLCHLVISDTGPGIAPDVQARIFEPFYRAPANKLSGTGIGLATVQRIVERHGGRVSVDSVLGEGSTFVVRLPVAFVDIADRRVDITPHVRPRQHAT